MKSTRSDILQNIRQALANALPVPFDPPQVVTREFVAKERFQQQLEKVCGSMTTVSGMTAVPAAVLDFLQKTPLFNGAVVMDSHLKTWAWPADLTIAYRSAQAEDRVSVSLATLGVAETGSVVLLSSRENPTTLNFLPEIQIIILPQTRLVLSLESVWSQLRQQRTNLPRAVHFITGPSRTADIEQTIQLGAHGPRSLHVIFVV
jgi:L-lactate dehydrogenase complex protein LldG